MTDELAELHLDPGSQLEELLAESVEDARLRESTTFDRIAGERATRIVLFGAGGLGRRTLAGLRAAGLEPLAFSDNRPTLWGTAVDGLPVFSPEDAARQFRTTAVFVVTIWGAGSTHRLADSVDQLNALGCDIVVPAAWLSWRYADELLPFYALDLPSKLLAQVPDVRRGFEVLGDDRSRLEYVTQVRWRLTGDSSWLAHPVPGPQYLVTDVASPLPDEVVLDCGAYDGDTLRSWIKSRGASFARYFAMEPDPLSHARLETYIAGLPPETAARVRVLPYSVASYTGLATFSASGSLSSSIREDGGITVDCIRLDDLEKELEGAVPTFLKVDIEGAELDALEGGTELLRRTHPMIAIASYHRQDHLWRVPLALRDLWSQYQCFLRPHNEEGWDLILYAVPPDRVPVS
jgi:FkbM family methyltransferase